MAGLFVALLLDGAALVPVARAQTAPAATDPDAIGLRPSVEDGASSLPDDTVPAGANGDVASPVTTPGEAVPPVPTDPLAQQQQALEAVENSITLTKERSDELKREIEAMQAKGG